MKSRGELSNACLRPRRLELIQPREKCQILPRREPRIKSVAASGVITEGAPDLSRLPPRVETRHSRASLRWQQQCRQYSQQSGFSRPICSEQRHRFAFPDLEGKSAKRRAGMLFEWLKQCPPSAASRRKKLVDAINRNRGSAHDASL